jgi:glycosyltransferase involved in cell wall biosynthesis
MLLSKPLTEDPRVVREANSLQARGHRVTVLQWARFDPEAPPTGEVSGIKVVRFPLTGPASRLPTTLLKTPGWWRAAYKQARRLHEADPFDAVHAHDLDTLPVGVRMKKRHGLRLVYDAHEIFSHMIEGDQPWPVPQTADRLERRLLHHVDHMITAGDTFKEHYSRIYQGPITVVHNTLWDRPGPWKPPTRETFSLVYIGTLSRDRMFPQLIDALGSLEGVELVIGGKKEGVYDQVETAARKHRNVTFLGPVPHQQVIEHTRACHALIVPLDPTNKQYRMQLANKAYDAMAAGRPLIGTRGTATGEFSKRLGYGITTKYDPKALQEAVRRLAEHAEEAERLGRHAHQLARSEYHWAPQGERLAQVYNQLLPLAKHA